MATSPTSGRIAARIDRLPLTRVQWELTILTQIAWGIIVGTDGIAAILYPFVWRPHHVITSFEYSVLFALEVGIGILLGDWVMGFVSDHYGRRTGLLLSAVLAGIFIWPFALVTNFWALAVLSVLATLGVGGLLSTNAVYMSEVLSPQVRGRVQLVAQMVAAFIFGVIMVGLLPYYLVPEHYQLFLYILAGLQLVFLLPLLAWRLPESPRWLEARGRHEDADRIMTQIEDRVRRYAGELPAPAAQEHQVLETGHAPMFELFQGEYAKRTILLLLCWILGYGGIIYGFAAYALVYFVDRGYDAHFTFLTSLTGAIVAAAALLVNSFWGEKVERRDTILLGATLFLIAVFFVYGTRGTATLVAGYYVARIGASLWLFNMYTYTANAYPTRLRAIGTGWTDGVGHLGAWGGSILAGTFYAIGPDHLGWFILIAVPGAIIPALLLRGFGLRQRQAVLEKLSA